MRGSVRRCLRSGHCWTTTSSMSRLSAGRRRRWRTFRLSKGRLRSVLRALDPNQRLAALAALALIASLFLPWWRDPVLGISYAGVRRLTFLEVALLLIAAGVLVLLLGRAERHAFHLPFADGTLVAASG